LTATVRARIATYTHERVTAARRRLIADRIVDGAAPGSPERDPVASAHGAKGRRARARPPSRAEIERIRAAAERAVAAQRALDVRFVPLGPVCGACTRDTGGCCSLTVPLLWREADYRLLALGPDDVPRPSDETSGACPFLGREGCRLPADRRPHICRAFLCERAEAALGDQLKTAWDEIGNLAQARSQLGG
jgi:hypothetical protein